MTAEHILDLAMARRAGRGLTLTFHIPGRSDPFTCFPKDDTQKAVWLANAKAKGWKLVEHVS
jgi:hypothetical protein